MFEWWKDEETKRSKFLEKSYLAITKNEAKVNVKNNLQKYRLCSENRGRKKNSWCVSPEWIPYVTIQEDVLWTTGDVTVHIVSDSIRINKKH